MVRPVSMRLSRRMFFAMSAAIGGAVAGLWSGCESPAVLPQTGKLPEKPASPPASAAGAASASSQLAGVPATIEETQPATQMASTGPAPDLGCEVFPDAGGKAIARASDAPVIVVPRADWTGARPNLAQIAVMNGIDAITVHHTAMQIDTDAWQPTAGELETIREFHSGSAPADRNWADIAYHFVVDRAGRVWQARPLAYQGAHVKGHNEHNLGIVLLGDFEQQTPSAAQLWSLGAFIGFTRGLYHVPLERVYTHGELGQTACPGKNLQAYMTRTRRAWGVAEGRPWEPVAKSG